MVRPTLGEFLDMDGAALEAWRECLPPLTAAWLDGFSQAFSAGVKERSRR